MSELTRSVTELINEFAKMPGIGKKSAERLAYYVLRLNRNEALVLADAIRSVKENVRYCRNCYNLAEQEECEICRDPGRNREVICVVEQPRDLMALEQAGVLSWPVSRSPGPNRPLGRDWAGAIDDRRPGRIESASGCNVREIVMATNPTVEGDGTALYISNLLSDCPVKVTRLGAWHNDRQYARIC